MRLSMVTISSKRAPGRKSARKDLPVQAREAARRRPKMMRGTGTRMMAVRASTTMKTSTRRR